MVLWSCRYRLERIILIFLKGNTIPLPFQLIDFITISKLSYNLFDDMLCFYEFKYRKLLNFMA